MMKPSQTACKRSTLPGFVFSDTLVTIRASCRPMCIMAVLTVGAFMISPLFCIRRSLNLSFKLQAVSLGNHSGRLHTMSPILTRRIFGCAVLNLVPQVGSLDLFPLGFNRRTPLPGRGDAGRRPTNPSQGSGRPTLPRVHS